jgi:hypothetical protein
MIGLRHIITILACLNVLLMYIDFNDWFKTYITQQLLSTSHFPDN